MSELGHGAMGVVYAAEDPLIGRTVAIKTIRLTAAEGADDRAMLLQRLHLEAKAAGVLSHPGIVTIYDVGEQGEDAYIVMEFVDGKSVEELFASDALKQPGTYLPILRGTAAAIDYAHSKGIIHRDIKPSNIMVCGDGTVKIADFGIAKLSESSELTQTGFAIGTPSYMSPEQAQARPVNGRADQFSLAVVAFRIVTGKLPFEGPTLTALLAKILWEEPEYESAGMDPALQPVFKQALSKDPQLRFPTCSDFVRGLEGFLVADESGLIASMTSTKYSNDLSRAFNAAFQVPDAAAGIPPEASGSGQGITTGAPYPTAPSPEAEPDKSREPDSRSSDVIPGNAAGKRKGKLLWAGSACIVFLALALLAVFTFKANQEPPPPPEVKRIDTARTQGENIAEVPPPSEPFSGTENPEARAVPQPPPAPPEPVRDNNRPPAPQSDVALPDKKKEAPSTVTKIQREAQKAMPKETSPSQPDKTKTKTPEAPVSEPEQRENAEALLPATSGVLTWSGELGRNSILVITGQNSSIGSIEGQFPGKPIKITVEPRGLAVRQLPSAANGWSQIILYSGNQAYSSITIQWNVVE